ncbi:MAG: ABC transporter permease [Chitinophagaceae bacterium]|nr:MAG: ABC transporter [Bacteroidetes bacterium OLB11]MCC6448926.1 ABC transporter permease [Chitinophagaceae bacterium]HMN32242.1 ABC transporter permease [Chitinophagaceae bacterium]
MSSNYSQLKALLALTKGSLISLLRSPSAIVFSIAFPLVFIVSFGLVGSGGVGAFKVDFVVEKGSDTINPIYQTLLNVPFVRLKNYEDSTMQNEDFEKGKIAAILNIKLLDEEKSPFYKIDFKTCDAAGNDITVARQILKGVIDTLNTVAFPENQHVAEVNEMTISQGREYKYMDFFLPGILGFSILSAGIFGTAFVFFSLRQTLVLKRFFTTPVKRIHIILSECFSRLIWQVVSTAIIILIGYYAFGFTLVNGVSTFIQMLILSTIGLILFLGMGFIVSSVAKNESLIPPLANMITLPQLLLSGVFMSVNSFPSWLQPFCNMLPLTQFNNAMRKIAFEGVPLFACWKELLILSIWGILVYSIAVKVFKWE